MVSGLWVGGLVGGFGDSWVYHTIERSSSSCVAAITDAGEYRNGDVLVLEFMIRQMQKRF